MATKPVNAAETHPSTEELARLPRAEQQARLGGNPPPAVSGQRTPAGATAQRTLSPQEQARRLALFQRAASRQGPVPPFERDSGEPDQTWAPRPGQQGMRQPDGGPHEGLDRRLRRVAGTVHPHAVDRDRDGFPDHGSTSSARMRRDFQAQFTRDRQVAAALPRQVDRNRDGWPDNAAPGPDGFRQDAIGYRQRLRAYREAYNLQREANPAPDQGPERLPVIDRPLPGIRATARPGVPPADAEPEEEAADNAGKAEPEKAEAEKAERTPPDRQPSPGPPEPKAPAPAAPAPPPPPAAPPPAAPPQSAPATAKPAPAPPKAPPAPKTT
jgi:hypothetical protein